MSSVRPSGAADRLTVRSRKEAIFGLLLPFGLFYFWPILPRTAAKIA